MFNINLSKTTLRSFVIILIILSLPFWFLGEIANNFTDSLSINIPISALMFICPMLTTLILVYIQNRFSGIKTLLFNTIKFNRKVFKWYLISFAIMPVVLFLSYLIMLLFKINLPTPQIYLADIPVFLIIFFISAFFEEVGWSSYLYDYLLSKFNIYKVGLIIGAIWAVWHLIPYIQTGNNGVSIK